MNSAFGLISPLGSAQLNDNWRNFAKSFLALAKIKNVNYETLLLSWEICRLGNDNFNTTIDFDLAALTLTLLLAEAEGHTFIEFAKVEQLLADVLHEVESFKDFFAVERLRQRLESATWDMRLVGNNFEAGSPIIIINNRVGFARLLTEEYLISTYFLEKNLASEATIENNINIITDDSNISLNNNFSLTDEQLLAVNLGSLGPFTFISGGPGTGKTTIIGDILRKFFALGNDILDIAIAAPTGKAAFRLNEALNQAKTRLGIKGTQELPTAQTIHRLLGFIENKGEFRYNKKNRLPFSLIVIDECSMLDSSIFEALLAACKSNVRLVFLGDAQQLPPINAGAVFRDILSLAPLQKHVVYLQKSFRMRETEAGAGRNVLWIASLISQGTVPKFVEQKGDDSSILLHKNLHFLNKPQAGVSFMSITAQLLQNFLDTWFNQLYNQTKNMHHIQSADINKVREIFASIDSQKILCFNNTGIFGIERINNYLHALYEQKHKNTENFYPGELVMVNKNDYTKGIFNGDVGIVFELYHDESNYELSVLFPRFNQNDVMFSLKSIESMLDLAFAQTVHKSQGSEYSKIVCVIPEKSAMASREILYTAITRARNEVLFLGSQESFIAAIQSSNNRQTFLKEYKK